MSVTTNVMLRVNIWAHTIGHSFIKQLTKEHMEIRAVKGLLHRPIYKVEHNTARILLHN